MLLFLCFNIIHVISIKFRRRFIFRAERMKTANKSRLTNNNSGRAVSFFSFAKKIICVIKIQRVFTEWKGARCARVRALHIYTVATKIIYSSGSFPFNRGADYARANKR